MGRINWGAYGQAFILSLPIVVGGPMLVLPLIPTEDQVKEGFGLEMKAMTPKERDARFQEFDDYVCKLKEYSKSDKNIWLVMAEAQKKERKENKRKWKRAHKKAKEDKASMIAVMREEAGLLVKAEA